MYVSETVDGGVSDIVPTSINALGFERRYLDRQYNGGAVVAMVGKDCVAIACDKRLGVQALTISTDFQKVFKVNDRTFIGLAGLASDVLTV